MRLHEVRHIDRSVAEVFAFTADFANSEVWDPGVQSSRRIDGGPVSVGSRYELLVTFGSREIPMTYEVTEIEPSRRVVLHGRGGNVEAVDEITFQPSDGGTRLEYTAELTFNNWLRFVSPLLAPLLSRVGERALDGLVDALER